MVSLLFNWTWFMDYVLISCLFYISSGQEDNIAEYYQQQVEVLEGFNEMDALAERGFIPGMSKVSISFSPLCPVDLRLIYSHMPWLNIH